MSLSYFYVNRDKEQFFRCGLDGLNNRFNRVGTEPGSRALAILLSEHGTWQGDRIAVVSDSSEEFEELVIRGIDIGVEVQLMLMKFDGLGWVEECLDVSISMFQRMCCYALLLRHADVTVMLDRKYGPGKWQKRYEKHLQGNTDLQSQRVVDAKNRALDLLRRRED
ncbi:hypothetical protein J8F10_36485 [Gemmata sp. G18]|uniref:Uncharacterized protein n=1 Tax=Gemmata palustris TaxID=2822762 RepID=A0ABS5C431_9BACT|nr:hypothetical protein [Gemmata palustris]MBP3960752.1 hypothetical protein [Gemmata palustris]